MKTTKLKTTKLSLTRSFLVASLFLFAMLVLNAFAPAARAANYWWNGSTTSTTTNYAWGNTANWDNAASGGSSGAAPTSASDTAIFNKDSLSAGNFTLANNSWIGLNGARAVGGLQFTNGTGGWTIAAHTTAATSEQLSIGAGGVTVGAGVGPVGIQSISGRGTISVALTADQTWNVNSPMTCAAISGAFNLIKSGTNSLTLLTANTYSGTTTVSAGLLSLGNTNQSSSSYSVSSGATLQFGNSGIFANTATISIVGSGTGTPNSAGALYFTANSPVTLNAPLTLGGATTISSYGISVAPTLGGAIGGTGPLTMAPRGGNATSHTAVWTLGAASDYSGNTIMKNNDGLLDATFKLGVANALPVTTSLNLLGTIGASGAANFVTLDLNGNPQTLAGLTDTGSSQANASGTIGKRVINSGALATLTINNSGADTYGTTGTQVLAGTLGGTTAGGAAANNLALVKTGTGTLILSGANTYSGATTISTGELIGNTAGSCASSAVTVSSGATNGVQLAATDGQWTCGGLTYNAGTTYADFDFTATAPSTTVAPLKISGNLAVNATVNVIVRRGSALTAGTSYPLITWTGTGPANLNGFGTVTLPAAMPGTLQLSGSTISVMAGIKVPNLAYTNATGTSRQITVADIVTAGLTSSQGSPTYTISLPSGTSTGGGSVTTDGSQILYQPSGSPSSDSFNYTVSDGTATATATVNITFQNQASGSNPQLTVSGGAVSGTLYGIPGQQYDIQRKTNLTDTVWETLGSPPLTNVPPYITADSAGRITFSDTNPPPSSGYYRTIQH